MEQKQYVATTTADADFNTMQGPVHQLVGPAAWLGPERKIIFHANKDQLAAMKALPEIIDIKEA